MKLKISTRYQKLTAFSQAGKSPVQTKFIRNGWFSILLLILALLTSAGSGKALTIKIDYRSDNGFLTRNPVARASVEKAAADLSYMITSSPSQIRPQSRVITGKKNRTTFQAEFTYFINDPVTHKPFKAFNTEIGKDLVIIYAGGRSLEKFVAGKGAPGSIQMTSKGSGDPHDWIEAVKNMEKQTNATYRRGAGPVIQLIGAQVNLGQTSVSYRIETGPNIGSLWFATDTNSDRRPDTPEMLERFWHYDHRTPVAKGKIDLYTVALHEIMHVLGLGNSASWDSNKSGNLWLGTSVRTTCGASHGLCEEAHIAPNVQARRIHDNRIQTPVMTPSTTPGERKLLTNVDMAFLRDLGWTIRSTKNFR